ncbi:hypothetical protein [Pseudanabaena sp. ABRG5-3]|uniref:hypothetical protein n=1 Tax=Pseudanabaena sp. ABRG5-3 TaxID=685565 RepID=UPI000DC6F936|nr:hypothetical protein [Pseudanabaena sp. ABRG5-3]BBC24986.1 restriction endonuclease family [Pseudanabaena sp. ABRG5-3]
MGSFTLTNQEFVCILSEATGFKTGVALDKEQLLQLFPDESIYKKTLSVDSKQYIRLHSSDVDEIFVQILYYLGNVEYQTNISSTTRLREKYKKDDILLSIYESILMLFIQHHELMIQKAISNKTKLLDPTEFMTEACHKFGEIGLRISYEIINGTVEDSHCNLSFPRIRRFNWEDTVNLESLFKSES